MKCISSAGLLLILVACASTNPAKVTTNAAPEEKKVECDLVCERAQLAVKPAADADPSVLALQNANDVLVAMRPSLLACYRKRVSVSPTANAFITIDVVIGSDGKVQSADTKGSALLGEETTACIVGKLRTAQFEPPRGGGPLRIHVPFSLKRKSPDEVVPP